MARLLTLIPGRMADRKRQIEANLHAIAKLIQDETRRELGEPYPRASRPGESPRKRSGLLQRKQYAHADPRTLTIEIGNNAPYAQELIASGRHWQRKVIARLRGRIDGLERTRMPFGGAP
jgi:hypothetical protein